MVINMVIWHAQQNGTQFNIEIIEQLSNNPQTEKKTTFIHQFKG